MLSLTIRDLYGLIQFEAPTAQHIVLITIITDIAMAPTAITVDKSHHMIGLIMTESAEGHHLVAHTVNVISYAHAEVEWEVASQALDGRWFKNDGREVIPFFTIPITHDAPSIPMGWVEHIQLLAQRSMSDHAQPAIDLVQVLGIKPKQRDSTPFPRRL